MTEKEKAAAGYLYDANYDPEILREIVRCHELCYDYNRLRPSDTEAQQALLRRILGSMKEDVTIVAPFYCDYGYNVSVGSHFFANLNLVLTDGGKITFGDHVFIAPNCCFTTAEHAIDAEQRNRGLEIAKPIKVGNNVWIGAGTTVLAGVTIGDNTVIGAGSVVTRDIPANVVAVGVPCRVMREITAADRERYPFAPEDSE